MAISTPNRATDGTLELLFGEKLERRLAELPAPRPVRAAPALRRR